MTLMQHLTYRSLIIFFTTIFNVRKKFEVISFCVEFKLQLKKLTNNKKRRKLKKIKDKWPNTAILMT